MEKDQIVESFDAYLTGLGVAGESISREGKSVANPLRERNRARLAKHFKNNKETRAFRETMKKRWGLDPLSADGEKKFPVLKESFSWSKFRTQLDSQLREADTSSAFTQFLVAGLLQNINAMYQQVKVSYQDWVTVTPTNLVETPIAGLQGLQFPREVGSQMPYPAVGAAALDLKIRARKYGSMYEVEKELLEDDQTGQFKEQTGMLGEYLQLLIEVLAYGKLASVANMSYAGFDVPISETKPSYETNWPWTPASAAFKGGGFNRPASYGTLTQANVQAGIEALMQQKNLLSQIMLVNPTRILISPAYRFDLAVLLNSSYYPSGAAAAGSVGGAFAINPLQGLADATVSRFMPDNNGVFGNNSKAWYLVDSTKPWIQFLTKVPVGVEQEAPNAGQSFERDIVRTKCYTRGNVDIIDPRFAWQGSDGSV
jgi:hypothetical protein